MKHMMHFAAALSTILAVCLLSSCSSPAEDSSAHPQWSYNAVIYEMNVRQYTPEGTFEAAERELPRLQKLGVDVVWLMPVYPIGVKERKGTLGSYYAISDYCAINPEFGTMEDFDSFLAAAHKAGFKLILDWVANHTSPDAVWESGKPADWYVRDSLGNTVTQYDWTDIAELNYDNTDMRAAMADAMRFWLDKGVDGFRCDMACEVPLDFWQETIPALRAEYPGIYFLAEGEEPGLHDGAFDASYAWELHHLLNDIAQGKKGVADLKDYIAKDAGAYPAEAFRLMFTSNHDENSWAGTEFERMGDAVAVMALMTFVLPQGQPLIYTGQEMGWDHRFEFFEKDPIPAWEWNNWSDFYSRLVELRHSCPALNAGEGGAPVEYIDVAAPGASAEGLMAFRRGNVTVLANLASADVEILVPGEEKVADWFSGNEFDGGQTVQMGGYSMLVFVGK